MSLLTAEGLKVDYGRQTALRDVSLRLSAGALHALVGPNGAGKSTLLRALAGDLEVQAGDITLAGVHLHQWRPDALARTRAFIPQRPEVGFDLSVTELLIIGRSPWASGGLKEQALLTRALERFDLHAQADRPVNALSGGQQARAHLARAVAQVHGSQTPWLLLDEPTAALDLYQAERAMAALRSLAHAGAGVVVALHDLGQALRYADNVVLLAEGALVDDGSPSETLTPARVAALWKQPVAPYLSPEGQLHALIPTAAPSESETVDDTTALPPAKD